MLARISYASALNAVDTDDLVDALDEPDACASIADAFASPMLESEREFADLGALVDFLESLHDLECVFRLDSGTLIIVVIDVDEDGHPVWVGPHHGGPQDAPS